MILTGLAMLFSVSSYAADTTAPSAPAGLSATAVSGTQINLTWSASTDDVGVTAYLVERCSGAACTNFAQIGTPSTASLNDTGRAGATTYRYRVRARDAANNLSAYSSIASATTPSDAQAPSTPATVSATVISSSQVNVSWSAATDNVGVTGYRLERCSGASCSTFVQVATPTAPSYSNTGLLGATIYGYRIRATDAGGNLSAYSSIVTATTPADTQAPTVPTALTVTVISNTQLTLSWSAASDVGGVTAYLVERCAGTSCTTFAQIASVATLTYNNTGLNPATSYSYRLRAKDAAGNLSAYSASATATTPTDTQAPTAPTNLTATVASATQLNLSWSASTDDVRVTAYLVERCTGASCSNFAQIGTPSTASLNDTGRTAATTYRYRVRARDAANNQSAYSSIVAATTQAASDTQAPTAPSTLTTTAISTSQINLSWTASTDNVGVTGYLVERCQGASCTTFAQIATPTTTTYSDTALTASTSYSYRVRATDAANNLSGYSNTSSATTQAPPDTQAPTVPSGLSATATSTTQITVSWTASTDNVGVTAYLLERCQGAGCTTFTQVASQSGTTFSDATLSPATTYAYRVRATDAANNLSGYSSTVSTATQYAGPITITYTYDNLGRISHAAGSDGSSIDYQYDANGNVTIINRQ